MPAGQPFTSLCQQMARPASAGRVDLHIHTTASDGVYTAAEVVDLACRSGLSALAVTDHDILDAIGPARAAAAGRLEIVAGVEISAEFHGKELHLLGYFFDPDDAALNKALADTRRQRSERFQEMVERLRIQGVPLEDEAWPGAHATIALGRRHLAEMLVKAGRAGNVRQAFFRYLGDHGRVAVPKRNMPVAEAISLIRAAGGVASWAHPGSICTETSLHELCDLGLQAVETDFPSCRPGRRHELRALASRLDIAVTGGSDCHGPGLPRRAIGACGLPAEELEVLRAKAQGTAGVA